MFGKGAPNKGPPKGRSSPPPKARSPPPKSRGPGTSPAPKTGAPPPKARAPPPSTLPPKSVPKTAGKPPGSPAGKKPPAGKPGASSPKKKDDEKKELDPPGPTRYRGITQNDDSDDDVSSGTRRMASSPLKTSTVETKMGIAGLGPTDADDDAVFEGYMMKRIGLGGPSTHYWEIRFFRIEKDNKNANVLTWWTSHFQDTRKGRLVIKPAVSTCMSFERDAYDEGRRRNLIGIQEKAKGNPVILDAPNGPLKDKWLAVFAKMGCTNRGLIKAERTNTQSVKEGWIVKQGAVVGTWHRRFLVLLPQMAMYYKWKRDKRPLGVIPLTSSGKVSVAPSSKGKNCLALIPNVNGTDDAKREYYIRCYDSDALKSWIKAFDQAMKGIR